MGHLLLLLVVALTVAAVVFGVTVLVTGSDPGLVPAEPDARAVPLPGSRPLLESDVSGVRFDTALRGYRMAQVDQALRRAAYDIGYKDELIEVLEAEVAALREGRVTEADELRRAREAALVPAGRASTIADGVTIDLGGTPAGTSAGTSDITVAAAQVSPNGETAPQDPAGAASGESTPARGASTEPRTVSDPPASASPRDPIPSSDKADRPEPA